MDPTYALKRYTLLPNWLHAQYINNVKCNSGVVINKTCSEATHVIAVNR